MKNKFQQRGYKKSVLDDAATKIQDKSRSDPLKNRKNKPKEKELYYMHS